MSYDFYLEDDGILIEIQGIQHEQAIEYFGGQESFEIQFEHDKRKRQYAQDYGLFLLEIWYYEFDNIEDILKSRLLKRAA